MKLWMEAALSLIHIFLVQHGQDIRLTIDTDLQVSLYEQFKEDKSCSEMCIRDSTKHYPQQITILKERISGMQADIQTAKENLPADKEQFTMKVEMCIRDRSYTTSESRMTATCSTRCLGRQD